MQKFNFSLAILFLLLVNSAFSQILPEKIFYKSTEQTDLNLFIYNPVDFDKSQTYNCSDQKPYLQYQQRPYL